MTVAAAAAGIRCSGGVFSRARPAGCRSGRGAACHGCAGHALSVASFLKDGDVVRARGRERAWGAAVVSPLPAAV